MKQTRQPTINLIILFLLTIATGVLFFFTQQQQSTTRLLSAEVDQLDLNRKKLDNLASNIPNLSLETANWLNTLPGNETEIAKFASELERIARARQLAITLDLDDFPGPVDVSGKYIDGLGVQIALEGTFQGVAEFLSDLTRSLYFFKVDNLTLTKPDSRPGVKAIINGAVMMNL